MSKIRYCLICNKKYEFCPHCSRVASDELWKNEYCSQECREIFRVCSRYAGNDISQEDAYNKLIELNVGNKNIQPSVRGTVTQIMEYVPPIKEETVENISIVEEETEPKQIETTVTVTAEPEDVDEVQIQTDTEEIRPRRSHRRRNKKSIEE